MKLDNITNQVYLIAVNEAKLREHEYVTPEHFLYALLLFDLGKDILVNSGCNISNLENDISEFLNECIEKIENCEPVESFSFITMLESAANHAEISEKQYIQIGDLIVSIFNLTESFAAYFLDKNGVKKSALLKYITHGIKSTKKEDEHKEISDKEVEFINKFTTELTESAYNGNLDPLIGRDDILERTMQVLSRRIKNNPVHVGEPGVGKTSIVEGVAQMIVSGNVPDIIKNSKIYYLDIGSVLAGTKYRGDFEERFKKILDIISKEENPIIYIDEIHTIVGAGSTSGGAMDATSILKPYLLKSNLKIIGSTTYTEYRKYFEKDSALVRRFQKIDVPEPSASDCIKILNGLKYKYENFHNVIYSDDAVKASVNLSCKYLHDKHLPDKAIDIIDESGASARLKKSGDKSPIVISANDIERTISKIARIPIEKLNTNETAQLKNLENTLKKNIFGQDNAVTAVVNAVKASRSGLNDSEKPIASLLFVGPTGVGKTEIAKQLASSLNVTLQRFDMSEYQEKHSVARLIGSPPGYVGYDEGGLLTESVNKSPYCVLLLDEIEKAHPDIFNVLLQVMDYGKLTDNMGKQADFRNVILIMTSNAGARYINKKIIGFDGKSQQDSAINQEIERVFSPEFRNRLDDIIKFNSIDNSMAVLIAKKCVNKLKEKLINKNIKLKVSEGAYNLIVEKGLSKEYGAREINRVVDNEIKKKLIDEVLFGSLSKGGSINIKIKRNNFYFEYSSC